MIWTPEPPEDSGQPPLPVFRVQPGRPLECVIECRNWLGVMTHYWNKQTIIHNEVDCPACDANWRPIWQGFLVVANTEGTRRILLQITPQAARCLDNCKRKETKLLGCRARFQRLGRRRNSPLDARCIGWTGVDIEISEDRLSTCVSRLLRIHELLPEPKGMDFHR